METYNGDVESTPEEREELAYEVKYAEKPEEGCIIIRFFLKESVDGLAIKESGVYVDVTFGGGGHSKEIMKR